MLRARYCQRHARYMTTEEGVSVFEVQRQKDHLKSRAYSDVKAGQPALEGDFLNVPALLVTRGTLLRFTNKLLLT